MNKLNKFIVAVVLSGMLTIGCWSGYTLAAHEKPKPKKIKIVFMQEHLMIDYGAAETYVQAKIDEKLEVITKANEKKTEYDELAQTAHEEYLAYLAQQRKARQASQVAYSEPTTTAESGSVEGGYIGTYKCTGYVATGNACANGNMPTSGYTIASNSLPMGTRVYIEGIGERVVEDTGGMSSNVIDIFVDSTSEAYSLTGDYEVYVIGD